MPSVWIESWKSRGTRTYTVRWETILDGKRHRGSVLCGPQKAYADKIRIQKTEELFSRRLGLPYHNPDASWAEFADAYLEDARKRKAPRTVNNFDARAMGIASQWFGTHPPASTTGHDVQRFESHLLERYSPTTARIWLRCLKTALRWGKENGFVREVPKIKLPRVEPVGRVLSGEEVGRFIANVPERSRSAIIFALHTGLRRGELLALTWDRIKKDEDGSFYVEVGGIGGPVTKTRESRFVPLPPPAIQAIGQPGTGRVFNITEDISHTVQKAAQKAGLGRVRFHDLRHTYATRIMELTGDVFLVMKALGHRSMATAKVYQHMTKTRTLKAAMVSFPGISPEKEYFSDGNTQV